ncbi:hypothetical protein CCH79_00011273, partial [Gambusia affinis]
MTPETLTRSYYRFKPNEGVIIIGATNFPEALDKYCPPFRFCTAVRLLCFCVCVRSALIRPGRFDMQVTVPKPDVKGRTEILNWYLKKIKVDQAIEANVIARGTVGFSGADLENLVNQAALKAAVDGKDMVTMKELEFAKDKILMGVPAPGNELTSEFPQEYSLTVVVGCPGQFRGREDGTMLLIKYQDHGAFKTWNF